MKLSIKNFQAWDELDCDISGLTVITGPSDVGKSSIFRALHGVLRNDLPAGFVKTGKPSLSVSLEVDGRTVHVSRGVKSSSTYTVDGEEFAKLGGEVPPVVNQLKFNCLSIGDMKLDPIFASQHEGKFLLQDCSPSDLNAILGLFGSTDKLSLGKKNAVTTAREIDGSAKTLSVEIAETESRKLKIGANIASLEPLVEVICGMQREVHSLTEKRDGVKVLAVCQLEGNQRRRVIHALDRVDITPVENKLRVCLAAHTLSECTIRGSELRRVEKALASVDELYKPLENAASSVNGVVSLAGALARKRILKRVQEAVDSSYAAYNTLKRQCVDIFYSITALEDYSKIEPFSIDLPTLNTLHESSTALWEECRTLYYQRKWLEVMLGAFKDGDALRRQVEQTDSEISSIERQLKELRNACPKCGFVR